MPMSMASLVVLAHHVHPNSVLFVSGPCLTQLQMADLTIHPCCFESSLAETLFHPGHLYLLFEEINLGGQRLALLVHGMVPVDFGHKTPIVAGELVKCMAEHCEGGPASHQGG